MARSAVLIVSLLILSICFYANAARFAIIDRPIGELDTKRMINLVTGMIAVRIRLLQYFFVFFVSLVSVVCVVL